MGSAPVTNMQPRYAQPMPHPGMAPQGAGMPQGQPAPPPQTMAPRPGMAPGMAPPTAPAANPQQLATALTQLKGGVA